MLKLSLVVFLIVVLTTVLVVQDVKERRRCREAAATLFQLCKAAYAGEHEYRVVPDGATTVGQDAGFREVHDTCVAAGLRPLGYFQNLTVKRLYPDHEAVLATYLHPSGTWGASTFAANGVQVTEGGAVTKDGRYIVTTNAPPGLTKWPPEVARQERPGLGPGEILAAHEARIVAAAEEPATEFVSIQTIDDAIGHSKALSRRISEFRRAMGYLTVEEMLRTSTRMGQDRIARRMWSHFSWLVREDRRRDG